MSSASSPRSIWTQWIRPVKALSVAAVVVADGCGAVGADVEGLVGGEQHRHCVASTLPCADLGAVEVEGDGAALAEAAAVVGELHPHLVVAGGDVGVAVDVEPLQAEQVVAVGGLPSFT